jgi:hypothetical protein
MRRSVIFAILALAACRGSVERLYDDQLAGDAGGGGGSDDAEPKKDGDGGAIEAGPTAPAKIGGTVFGLIGGGLVLQNDGKDDLEVKSGGAFVFPTALPPGAHYDVTVRSQPTGPIQSCQVTNGSGTANGADVLDVQVACVTDAFTVGGTVVGLTGSGLILQNNGGNDLPVSNDGTFTFTQPVPSGSNFNVTVKKNPSLPTQTCRVSGATGQVVAAAVDSVVVNCGTNTYTVGGTVSGLAGTLVITNNGNDARTITANGSYAFSKPITSGGAFSVAVKTQPAYPPANQTCNVSGATGNVGSSNISSVNISCGTLRYRVGGTVSGLTGAGLVLQNNGGDDKSITAAGPFTFGTTVASGSPYSVSVKTQPANQICSVTGQAGTVTTGDVSTPAVSCVPEVVLSESFDASSYLPSGWSSTIVSGSYGTTKFGTTTTTVGSAPYAAYVKCFSNKTEVVLDSPSIPIASSAAQLSFWNSYDYESQFDGGVLEIAIGGGAFTDIITAGGSFAQGGYNQTIRSDSTATIKNRQAWSAQGTVTTIVNLPASAKDKSIVLRWRSATDGYTGAGGWRIDNVVVKNG